MREILLPKTVKVIEDNALNSEDLTLVVCLSETPPQIGENTFSQNTKIFVTKDLVDVYKTAWTNYSENIYEFPEYNYQDTWLNNYRPINFRASIDDFINGGDLVSFGLEEDQEIEYDYYEIFKFRGNTYKRGSYNSLGTYPCYFNEQPADYNWFESYVRAAFDYYESLGEAEGDETSNKYVGKLINLITNPIISPTGGGSLRLAQSGSFKANSGEILTFEDEINQITIEEENEGMEVVVLGELFPKKVNLNGSDITNRVSYLPFLWGDGSDPDNVNFFKIALLIAAAK